MAAAETHDSTAAEAPVVAISETSNADENAGDAPTSAENEGDTTNATNSGEAADATEDGQLQQPASSETTPQKRGRGRPPGKKRGRKPVQKTPGAATVGVDGEGEGVGEGEGEGEGAGVAASAEEPVTEGICAGFLKRTRQVESLSDVLSRSWW